VRSRRRREVEDDADEWDRGVSDWERCREEGGPAGVGWVGNCRWAAGEERKKKRWAAREERKKKRWVA
jgi:hypothetical protein